MDNSQWRKDIEDALDAFSTIAELGGAPLAVGDVTVEFLTAPHKPPTKLPPGKVAVYGFWGDGCWLKIGVAGQNSNARYTSQHYNAGSSRSNLAQSLQRCPQMLSRPEFLHNAPGEWIKISTHRVNILVSAAMPKELPLLLEAFLHLRLRPRYER